MMTPSAKSFLISVFIICIYIFISCSLCGILGSDVIPGLSLKLIFRPFFNNIKNYSVTSNFLPYSIVIFKLPAITFLTFLPLQLIDFSSCNSCSCFACFPFSLWQSSSRGDIRFLIVGNYCWWCCRVPDFCYTYHFDLVW